MRTPSSSLYPFASGMTKPTQSTNRTFTLNPSSNSMVAALFGTNFGSVVMIVLPIPACGSSSIIRAFSYSSGTYGSTALSINSLINVDFPTRTGPTIPKYISPPHRCAIFFIISVVFMMLPPLVILSL